VKPNPAIALPLSALCLLISCAGPGAPRSASGTRIDPIALSSAEQTVTQRNIPEELRADYIALYSQGRQNAVLHAMRAGLSALRIGRYDLAKETFDQAIREVEALQEGAEQAKRAKSKFVAEREKWFKGESHERSALYFYRGLIYLNDQDFGNAAACFKRSQIQDITADDQTDFSGDWYGSEIALALASYLNGFPSDADAARQRARTFQSKQGEVPWPSSQTNTLIVVEVGKGPIKYRGGRQGEQLRYSEELPATRQLRISSPAPHLKSAAAENLFFQAITRGDRQVDHILGDKASFKEDTGSATVGLAAGAIVASQVDRSGIAAGVLGLAAIGTAIASAASDPSADIREWDNLPHSIYLLSLNLPDPKTPVQIETLDAGGTVLNTYILADVTDTKKEKRLNIRFLRLKN